MSVQRLVRARVVLAVGLMVLSGSDFHTLFTIDFAGPTMRLLEPVWFFHVFGIDRAHPVTVLLAFGLLMVGNLALLVGFRVRAAIAIICVSFLYLQGVRDSTAGDEHHRFYMWFHALLLLAFSRFPEIRGAGRLPVDPPLEAWQTSWPIRAAQTYVCGFYFVAGLAKLRVSGLDWVLDGTAIQKMLIMKGTRWGIDDGTLGWFAENPLLCHFTVLSILVMELGFPLVFFLRAKRAILAFLVAMTVFHWSSAIFAEVNFWVTPALLFALFYPFGETPPASELTA
ncbi:MAG: HTTM domain-containing protein [Sandaracinaceae bacterium]|nr:HTTM domain-containing protein [Sandaracinaceae bacterium]MBK6807969.1 HTTM domain-containing protein [Sandaracinaceae bacterium]MBK7150870.1 HTTM domain-containing protein [Sandaracinaceae bacterium]MBK7772994.1 HTTM domain-containing protein [Sandaracinaceae bacterium]MBK8407205.1 HTTM domain-containing protein [Sandaracinaceae bacterium]